MSVETRLMTADELLAMPEGGAHKYELVRGELITMSPGGLAHGIIGDRIGRHLGNYVATHKLGVTPNADTGYLVAQDPDTVLEPDASFIAADRVVATVGYFPGPPDLAIEVISPNDTYGEVDQKVGEYIAGGTRMVVVINPRNRIVTVTTSTGMTRLTINDTLTGGDVVPGWSLPLRELFED